MSIMALFSFHEHDWERRNGGFVGPNPIERYHLGKSRQVEMTGHIYSVHSLGILGSDEKGDLDACSRQEADHDLIMSRSGRHFFLAYVLVSGTSNGAVDGQPHSAASSHTKHDALREET